MSKKINTTQIANELRGSSSFFNERDRKKQADVVTSQNDITTSEDDINTPNTDPVETNDYQQEPEESQRYLDIEKLQTVIKSLSEIQTSAFTTPVRLSSQEKKDIEDFI